MDGTYGSAINALLKKLEEAEKRPAALRLAINILCEESGRAPLFSITSFPTSVTQKDIESEAER